MVNVSVTGLPAETPPDLHCTIDDVAALIRARTKDANGNELGTFTDTSRPTDIQVEVAIDHQVVLVHTKVGQVGDGCADLARGAVALGAAAEVELSYFPEQIASARSAYPYLIERYGEALDGLLACVQGNLPDDAIDGAASGGLRIGTIDAISATVEAHYTGRVWPALPAPPPAPIPDEEP